MKLVLASASLRGDLDLDVLSSLPAVWSSSGQGFQHQTPHRRFEEGHGGGLFSEAGALTQSGFAAWLTLTPVGGVADGVRPVKKFKKIKNQS